MRIDVMITEDESNWYFNKFSPIHLLRTYRDNIWEFKFLILGLKGLSVLFGMQLQETLCAIINISDSFSYEKLLVLLHSSFRQCQYNIQFCLLDLQPSLDKLVYPAKHYVFIQIRQRVKNIFKSFSLGAFSGMNLYIFLLIFKEENIFFFS